MAAPVVHFEIMGKDGLKLQKFYGELFGWKIQNMAEMGNYGMSETGAQGDKAGKGSIDGGVGGTQPGAHNYVTVYIQVKDIDAHLKKIAGMGGKTVTPKTVIPNIVTFAQFTDPEGNVVGLVEG